MREGEFGDDFAAEEMFLDDAFQNLRRATVIKGVLFYRNNSVLILEQNYLDNP